MTYVYDRQYINGDWCASQGDELIVVQNPNTGELAAQVTTGHPQDAQAAVQAAQAAFPRWSALALEGRVQLVLKWAAALQERKESLVRAIAAEVGTPLRISRMVQVEAPLHNIENFVDTVRSFEWEKRIGNSLVVRDPFGVVACITPWNFPLHQIVLKLVPALLTGNTVVLKPSELTPQTVQLIVEALHEAGFPDGVVNVVNGCGPTVGACLAGSDAVDMVSFTGSTEAGKAVIVLAAQNVKKVATELGGKSPSVVLPGAELERAIKASVAACMLNNGQTCSALTRLLIPVERVDEAIQFIEKELAKLSVGCSLDEGNRIGPLISSRQQAKVESLLETVREQGGVGIGVAQDNIPDHGFFIAPQAFKVDESNILAHAEVFGPVLAVLTYTDVDEAVRIANSTIYGLAAAVWGDEAEAVDVARRIQAGQVDINGARFNALAPFGGYKQSGVGREAGEYGVEEFLQVKSIQTQQQSGG
ncbi:aldehyde dehydrogenase family protein [Alcaligenes sp. 13f]|uniref:aldehyde dehydrogenase family protein n=1 Tax=Alcaligenes sp. 13f TaxID=2841924 RepID=UPI001CF6EA97|nr:aldehyde dehydrogenase family protein [Alcaligenes sp. 13f]MCB4321523.1 aldehyde dehydrogenase family protein [Alcaligenes sp. 13f]